MEFSALSHRFHDCAGVNRAPAQVETIIAIGRSNAFYRMSRDSYSLATNRYRPFIPRSKTRFLLTVVQGYAPCGI